MSAAERALADAMLNACGLNIRTTTTDPSDIQKALEAVAEERVPPEAKEKFMALSQRHDLAQRELRIFCDTLPRAVLEKWWREVGR